MKKFLLGTVGLVALSLSAPASAADLAARPYTKAPPMIAAIYDWSGFYIGVNGGWGSSRKCWDFVTAAGVLVASEGCHDATGGTVGGQIGYRWQAASWVFGLEAQGNWADFKGCNVSLLFPTVTNHTKIDAFGLFTGQVGYAWNNALLYVKGGAAVTVESTTHSYRDRAPASSSTAPLTRPAGVAWSASASNTASPRTGRSASSTITSSCRPRDITFTNTDRRPACFATDRIRQDVDLVTARINYRWGGPVVAKY